MHTDRLLCTRHTRMSHTTTQQKVLQIIREVADAHVNAASHAIQRSIAETMDEVTFVLDKASIRRPTLLGTVLYNTAVYSPVRMSVFYVFIIIIIV